MGDALSKAKEKLKKANDLEKEKGDNSEKVAEGAAEALRALIEATKKKDAAPTGDIQDAINLLYRAFKKNNLNVALTKFATRHSDEALAHERNAENDKKTPTPDAKTEEYTQAAREHHLAAVAMARVAKIAMDQAAAFEEAAKKSQGIGKKVDSFDSHAAAGDAARLAGTYFSRAAADYVYAADLEGAKPHDQAEKKLELAVASELAGAAAKSYDTAAEEHKAGGKSDDQDKQDRDSWKQAAKDYKTQADNIQ